MPGTVTIRWLQTVQAAAGFGMKMASSLAASSSGASVLDVTGSDPGTALSAHVAAGTSAGNLLQVSDSAGVALQVRHPVFYATNVRGCNCFDPSSVASGFSVYRCLSPVQ
jgi:hypothetical protein